MQQKCGLGSNSAIKKGWSQMTDCQGWGGDAFVFLLNEEQ